MEQDDPEKRISDLERQLAEPRAADADAVATSDRLTPEQVHTVAFSKPRLFKRGYNEDEVDAFLDRVEATLRDPTARDGITPAELHDVAFSKPPTGKRGYSEDEVDAFVDLVKVELSRRLPGSGGPYPD
jgi:DivIVA domain-containing protein